MIITQLLVAPSKKIAVSYDVTKGEIVMQSCELLGLVQLENPDEPGEIQQVPCYLLCNNDGYFYVPELEFDFLTYVNPHEELDMTIVDPRIKAIINTYKEAKIETIEVQTQGKISTIKRTVRKLSDKPPTIED